MKILISGSNGLIGHALYKKLANSYKKSQIYTIGRHKKHNLFCDLNKKNDLDALSSIEIEADIFIHCAGVTNEEIEKNENQATTRAGLYTKKLLDKTSCTASFLVYISSAHVYGDLVGVITEETPENPKNTYAKCHLLTEKSFLSFGKKHQIPVLILRPCAVFGPLNDLNKFNRWSLIPFSFPKSLVENKEIILQSDGKQIRNFISTEQIANLVIEAIEDKDKPQTYKIRNAVGSENLSVIEFAKKCKSVFEVITGTSCTITKKSNNKSVANKLIYSSLTPQKEPLKHECSSLENHIETLISMLISDKKDSEQTA